MSAELDADPALGLFCVLDETGRARAGATIDLELARKLARHMRRVRRLDERMAQLQRQGRIGFYGSARGQEAAPVAAALALAASDWVFPGLRESALLFVRGLPLAAYLAQLFGNQADILKGRQMPSHHASRRLHHVSWSSAIGTQLPQAVGAAYAARRLARRDAVLAFLGDGATSHPDFHAALNFAGVFGVGVVFVCQNNQYAISVPAARQTAAKSFAIKARAYAVAPERIDGNDALAIHTRLAAALGKAREGGGPTFIECVTYRMGPHSSSDDPARYRGDDEVARWSARDPIARLEKCLAGSGAEPAELGADEREIDAEIDATLPEIESLGAPARASLFDDVYARLPWHLREQRAALEAVPTFDDERRRESP